MRSYLLCLFSCLHLLSSAQSNTSFPSSCQGKYEGTLYIEHIDAGLVDSAQVELSLLESSNEGTWDFVNTISNERYGTVVKNYKLYKKDSLSNVFVLDENNGIYIDHSVFQNGMFSFYEVAGSYFAYSLECLDSGELFYEIATSSLKSERVSELEQEKELSGESFIVKSYIPFTRQWARLQRLSSE